MPWPRAGGCTTGRPNSPPWRVCRPGARPDSAAFCSSPAPRARDVRPFSRARPTTSAVRDPHGLGITARQHRVPGRRAGTPWSVERCSGSVRGPRAHSVGRTQGPAARAGRDRTRRGGDRAPRRPSDADLSRRPAPLGRPFARRAHRGLAGRRPAEGGQARGRSARTRRASRGRPPRGGPPSRHRPSRGRPVGASRLGRVRRASPPASRRARSGDRTPGTSDGGRGTGPSRRAVRGAPGSFGRGAVARRHRRPSRAPRLGGSAAHGRPTLRWLAPAATGGRRRRRRGGVRQAAGPSARGLPPAALPGGAG